MVFHQRKKLLLVFLLGVWSVLDFFALASESEERDSASAIGKELYLNSHEEEWCIHQTHGIFSHVIGAVSEHVDTIHSAAAGTVPIDPSEMQNEARGDNTKPFKMSLKDQQKSSHHNKERLVRLWRKRQSLKGMGLVRKLWKEKQQHLIHVSPATALPKPSEKEFGKPMTESTKQHTNKPGKVRRFWNRAKKVFTSNSSKEPSRSKRKAFVENIRYYGTFDEETVAGAKLLSGSFQLLSGTAGFLADTVRVSGDTAAGIMGSSVKVIGSVVKSVGTGLSSASRRLDKNNSSDAVFGEQQQHHGKDNTNMPHHQQQYGNFESIPGKQRQKKKFGNLGKHARRLAAKSVKLVGSVIGGVGESLLIAGVAAESLTSSTAGVAEETVRILENLAGTISVAISLKSRRRQRSKGSKSTSTLLRKKLSPYYLSFGTYEDGSAKNETATTAKDKSIDDIVGLLELLVGDAGNFWRFVSSDIDDVPSMAAELLVALLLCHMFAIVLLSHKSKTAIPSTDHTNKEVRRSSWSVAAWLSRHVGARRASEKDESIPKPSKVRVCLRTGRYITKQIVLLPFRIIRFFLWSLYRFLFNRKMLLLAIYALIWTNMAQLSQERALIIQRRAEATGFRNGLASLTGTSAHAETAVWLNHIFASLWRVQRADKIEPGNEAIDYPIYVLRSFEKESSQGAYRYGGLEPYLSSLIGKGIVKGLEVKRPTDVAYVSLYSLSLGSKHPVIRKVEVTDTQSAFRGNRTRVELNLDVDALLEDMSLILEVKLSSLSYALLPSTKIKVFNLDFRGSIKAVVLLEPEYPFVSSIELSMLQQPDCNLRVTPVGNDSGLKGVDLGSIPFLKDWIQEAIRSTLSNYVTPHYITIDVAAILSSDRTFVPPLSPYLETLRQRTSFFLANPRTTIPEAIAITSVADKLESHQSSTQVVRPESDHRPDFPEKKRKETIVKPVTELSRLALDRYNFKEENRSRIRPTTELSRMAMDRWVFSDLLAKLEDKS